MKRERGLDLLSTPNEFCPHVGNDHPPMCQQPPNTSCLKCPIRLDGMCNLIPWDKMTEAMEILLALYKKRDAWYAELDPIYKKIHSYDDPIQKQLKVVREEQGR